MIDNGLKKKDFWTLKFEKNVTSFFKPIWKKVVTAKRANDNLILNIFHLEKKVLQVDDDPLPKCRELLENLSNCHVK